MSTLTLPRETSHLRLITPEPLIISACAGGPTSLANTKKTFTGYVDSRFKDWKLDTEQPSTQATSVLVYKLHKDGTFMDVYSSFNVNKAALAFGSQEQVEKFAIEHRALLRTDGYVTFFLFTEEVNDKKKFFVALVSFDSGGRLWVDVSRLSSGGVWGAGGQHRFVVPATGPLGA